MLVQADALIETADRIHRPGHLRFQDQQITEVGSDLLPMVGEEVLRLPGLTLAPGFINLHAHLELSGLHGRLQPGPVFSEWLRQVIAHLPELTPERRRESVVRSSQSALRSGTTSILSILSNSLLLAGLASTATRTWWALEFMDLHEIPHAAEILDRTKALLLRHPCSFWHLALSPHSPYTASPNLYRSIARLAEQHSLPFTTHLAESPEETLFLQGQPSGLLSLLPPVPPREDRKQSYRSAADWSQANDTLPTHPLLAHGNEVRKGDEAYLAEKKATVVHCPLAHRWFARTPFPLDFYQAAGIPVCLGTDSPAGSNNSRFDLREEAAEFRKNYPQTPTRTIWDMITTRPAGALQLGNRLGCLRPGFWADWVAWRIPIDQDLPESILTSSHFAEWTCVGGVVTHHEAI